MKGFAMDKFTKMVPIVLGSGIFLMTFFETLGKAFTGVEYSTGDWIFFFFRIVLSVVLIVAGVK